MACDKNDKVLTTQGSKFIVFHSCELIKMPLALLLFQSWRYVTHVILLQGEPFGLHKEAEFSSANKGTFSEQVAYLPNVAGRGFPEGRKSHRSPGR